MLSIRQLGKSYGDGLVALEAVNLEARVGELFALLGPNGAGKTTLINIICGIVTPTADTVLVGGHDIVGDYRRTCQAVGLLLLVAFAFSLAGFIIGIWAEGFEALQFIPMLVVTPLTFPGGVFYSIDMLPATWQTVTPFNPIIDIVSGFRDCFFGAGDVSIWISLTALMVFIAVCLTLIGRMVKTGYKLKS
ncbi:MAG: ABC transporter permease [Pseudomonadota bacterium]|nr:MAG: ABC transporter permease [Pseudomonadota bacterium]